MPKYAMIVHGYSERSLSAYGTFPGALKATVPDLESVVLSAFNSLDDGVTIDDLAVALEDRMQHLEAGGNWRTENSVFICHSTGALVVRRWLLNRLGSDKPLPTHLITMAGANHGSSLAQIGRTPLVYAERYLLNHLVGVGARVLTDLDYGSMFLLKLNFEWLLRRYGDGSEKNAPDPRLASMFVFSMGGDSLGNDPAVKLLWASSERGSDNTVRISGANLNYTYLIADVRSQTLKAVKSVPQAHLVVPGMSHYGPETGIMAANSSSNDPPMVAILAALGVHDAASYKTVLDSWSKQSATWVAQHPDQAAATVIFNIRDQGGEQISDSFIGFLDATVPGLDAESPQENRNLLVQAMRNVTGSIEDNQPIHNNVNRGSYSFYVNAGTFNSMSKHVVTIEAKPLGDVVTYGPLNFTIDQTTVGQLVFANQCTYVDLTIPRYPDDAYAFYDGLGELPLSPPVWPPFDPTGRIDPAPVVA
jgi:hypothetical protein